MDKPAERLTRNVNVTSSSPDGTIFIVHIFLGKRTFQLFLNLEFKKALVLCKLHNIRAFFFLLTLSKLLTENILKLVAQCKSHCIISQILSHKIITSPYAKYATDRHFRSIGASIQNLMWKYWASSYRV